MPAKLEDLVKHRQARRRATARNAPTGDTPPAGRRGARRGCPICGQPALERYRPFCSRRCADIDLGRWLNESYRAPAEEAEPPGPSDASGED